MAGRPPKPTALKKLAGNPGRRKLPKDEPMPPASNGQPPAWITPGAREAWDLLAPQLLAARVLTELDVSALWVLCELMATFRGRCASGETSTNLASEIRQALGRFGMTPADRVRVSAKPEEEVDPFEAFAGLKVVGGKQNR